MPRAKVSQQSVKPVRLPASRVLGTDWNEYMLGPYSRLPSDRNAVIDGYLMQRYDPTVGAVLTVMRQLMISKLGQYEHEDDTVSEFVNGALGELRGGLEKTALSLLSVLWAGFAVAEKVWRTDSEWRLASLELVHPLTFWGRIDGKPGIVYDRKAGGVTEVVQKAWNYGDTDITLPIESVVYWPFQQELREEVYGRRLTDRCRRNWYMRSKLETYWSIYLERYASPTVIFRVPRGGQEDPETGVFVRNAEYYSKALQSLGPGNGFAIELGPDEVFGTDVIESHSAGEGFLAAIQYANAEVFKALLMSPVLLEEPQHASRAQSSTVLDLFITLVEAIRSELGAVLADQVCWPMVVYNFPGAAKGRWRFEPLLTDDKEMLARILDLLSRGGAVRLTDSDERLIRELYGEAGLAPWDELTPEELAAAEEAQKQVPPGFGGL